MIRCSSVRHAAALGVAAVVAEAVLSTIDPGDTACSRLIERVEPAVLPAAAAPVLGVLVGVRPDDLYLLARSPKGDRRS